MDGHNNDGGEEAPQNNDITEMRAMIRTLSQTVGELQTQLRRRPRQGHGLLSDDDDMLGPNPPRNAPRHGDGEDRPPRRQRLGMGRAAEGLDDTGLDNKPEGAAQQGDQEGVPARQVGAAGRAL